MSVDSLEGLLYHMRNVKKNGIYQSVFHRFIDEIPDWSSKGDRPKTISRQQRYSLEMTEKRWKEHNLQIVTKYENVPGFDMMSVEYPNKKYKNVLCFQEMRVRRAYFHNGKEIKRKAKNNCEVISANVTDVTNNHDVYEEDYNCPNCGAVEKIKNLENGCSYCGTKFKMPDLFPKVTSYYTVPTIDNKRVNRGRLISILISICVLAGIMIFNNVEFFREMAKDPLPILIIKSIFYLGVLIFCGVVLGTIIYTMGLLLNISFKAGESANMLAKTRGSKRKMEKKMRKVEQNFSYEFFEAKMVSMVKMLLFCENPKVLTIYQGSDSIEECKNIVDVQYAGAIGLRKFQIENGITYVSMELFLTNTRIKNDKLYDKDERYTVTVARRILPDYHDGFEITKVKCHYCGGSFDAMKIKKCPYCNNEYHLMDDDWTVMKLKRSK